MLKRLRSFWEFDPTDYMREVLTPQGKQWVDKLVTHIEEDILGSNVETRVDERYWDLEWMDSGTRAVLLLPEADS